jgi:pantoate--beta-alanine ligase
MQTITSVSAMKAWSRKFHRHGVVIGLVPTMGALHAGHRALIRAARLSCDTVVVSVFVNPAQFDRRRDLARYPRSLAADKKLCVEQGVDILFAPPRDEMYPMGFQTSVTVQSLARRWEGEHRPGHFEGVTLVVAKLLTLIQPRHAFFGQKDYQQSVIVRQMVRDLNFDVQIEVRPTVREKDGLALSSRNLLLSRSQRRAAPALYAALHAGRDAIVQGTRTASQIRRAMQKRLLRNALARPDYLAVCDPETLEPVSTIGGPVVLLGAIRIGQIRLIDNLMVKAAGRRAAVHARERR